MSIETKRRDVPSQTDSGNAILVDMELVSILKSALKKGASPIDILPATRDLLDLVVLQTTEVFNGRYIYRSGTRKLDKVYKYFGSETSMRLSNNDRIVDKGRYVEACIIAYLYGAPGMAKYCVSAKEIRPRVYTTQGKQEIADKAAEIADAKDVVSQFVPTTYQG